jgi:ribosomal protein S18 acetylase RimI-like enzyme
MANEIVYKDLSDGPVEICRDLRDRLMAHQAQMSDHGGDILSSMTFDNRLKYDFDNTDKKCLYVAFDGDKPVGYIFLTEVAISDKDKDSRPSWANVYSAGSHGMYPEWMETPAKIGDLNNLYVYPEYRGYHIGGKLAEYGMNWLKNETDSDYFFVYVSNGNNPAPFYEKLGFEFSHLVFDGFIRAYYIDNREGERKSEA